MIDALAIWGYGAIKSESAQVAKKAAIDEFGTYMNGEEARREINKIIARRVDAELKKVDLGVAIQSAYSQMPPPAPGQSKPVGRRYPK